MSADPAAAARPQDTATPAGPQVCVRIDEFTDPLCPFAYSAEPFRIRLRWLYEGRIEWVPRMVVLADSREAQAEKGLDAEKIQSGHKQLQREHRMPMDTRLRDGVPASIDACRAVVAARIGAEPGQDRALLRRLRVLYFAGGQLDDRDLIERAAEEAGIPAGRLAELEATSEVEAELEADMAAAREPRPAARVLDGKLANWSGGRRYTCPSYEITRLEDSVTIAVPGFQPFAVYDTILANLVPGMERRPDPASAPEVLEWSAIPLSTQEVAVILDVEFDEAREELGRVAGLEPVGADGFWTL